MTEERKRIHGVEIFLDNRQVFLLFFASAVVLSLVFTLGVVVGKRAERTTAPPPASDPLTMLDQMGGNPVDDNLTFHEELTGGKAAAKADAAAPQAEPKPEEGEAKPPATEDPEPQRPAASLARSDSAKPAKRPEKAEKVEKAEKAREAKSSPKQVAKKGEGNDKEADPDGEEAANGYTLQLSAFQDRHEAELFMQKLREGKMQPYMVATTIPGRGVWYRVRLGNYTSWDEALAAKQTFERQQKIIAYVAKK